MSDSDEKNGQVRMKNLGERIYRIGQKLYRVNVVSLGKHCNVRIEHDGERLMPWTFCLRIFGKNRLTDEVKRDFLRHDADASQVLESEIECKACDKHLKFIVSFEPHTRMDLSGWLVHKLTCGPLQQTLREELAAHGSDGDQHAGHLRLPKDGVSAKTAMLSSKDGGQGQKEIYDEFGTRKALCRTGQGIKEVDVIRHAHDHKLLFIVMDGKHVTPLRFRYTGDKTNLSSQAILQFAKQDPDGDFRGDTICCQGCAADISIVRRGGTNYTLWTWAMHQLKCVKLQERYQKELNGGVEEKEQPGEKKKSISKSTKSGTSASATRRISMGMRTRASSRKDAETMPAEPTTSSNKRALKSEEVSNPQPSTDVVVCKRRRIATAGDVNEVEMGFPPSFAAAHPEIVAKFLDRMK